MRVRELLIRNFYFEIINFITNDKAIAVSIIKKATNNYNKLNKLYSLLTIMFLILINLIILLLFFVNKKKTIFFLFKVSKKIKYIKNINNFLFSNILLNIF